MKPLYNYLIFFIAAPIAVARLIFGLIGPPVVATWNPSSNRKYTKLIWELAQVEAAAYVEGFMLKSGHIACAQAQVILESGYWGSDTMNSVHNQIGMSYSDSRKNRTVNPPVKSYSDSGIAFDGGKLAKYSSNFECYRDLFRWYKQNPNDVMAKSGFADVAAGVKAAGYAVDPNYVSKLTEIKDREKLPFRPIAIFVVCVAGGALAFYFIVKKKLIRK